MPSSLKSNAPPHPKRNPPVQFYNWLILLQHKRISFINKLCQRFPTSGSNGIPQGNNSHINGNHSVATWLWAIYWNTDFLIGLGDAQMVLFHCFSCIIMHRRVERDGRVTDRNEKSRDTTVMYSQLELFWLWLFISSIFFSFVNLRSH